MNLLKIKKDDFRKDLLLALFLGLLSFLLGNIRFTVFGFETALSDFREIPLLIGLFYFTNPLYIPIMSLLTMLATPNEGSYIVAFIMHFGALTILLYIFQKLNKISSVLYRDAGIGLTISKKTAEFWVQKF